MKQKLRHTRRRHFQRKVWRTRFIFWGGAILVGVCAALFALLSEHADRFFRLVSTNSPYLPFIITPLGLVIAVAITRKVFPGAEGSGIPQTFVALENAGSNLSKKLLSFRVATGKVLMTMLALLCGASLGREGPTVHLGAAIMCSLGRYTHLPAKYLERGLILTGGGAGIAAAFNTPLAGIIFAIEEMARTYDRRNSSMMLIGVVLAGMTAIAVHQNNYNYYGTSPANLDFGLVWLAVIICGLLGGVLGGSFSQLLISGGRQLRPYVAEHWIKIAILCGTVVAITGLLSGGTTYGTGYIEAKQIVSCSGVVTCASDVGFFYPFLKMLATIASYLSGVPGGIFSPSLASGAGLGNDLALYFPAALASTVIVLAMVGYFSGVVQTPITAFVIVMEMTDNQDLVLALMATSLIATGTSKLICKKSIYSALAEQYMIKNNSPEVKRTP